MRFALLQTLIVATFASGAAVAGEDHDGTTAILESTRAFCQFELGGAVDPDRRKALVVFSGTRLKELSDTLGGLDPYVFEWKSAPLVVVSACDVISTARTGESATALVRYTELARRDAWNGAIHSGAETAVDVPLLLRHAPDGWRVSNPGAPHLSRETLIQLYRGVLDELPRKWALTASVAQLSNLRDDLGTLLLLESL